MAAKGRRAKASDGGPGGAGTDGGPRSAGSDGAAGLPRSLALVWGLQERPRRGPKPGLSLERIVRAAIELADTEGLAALSMSRLAEKLGFTTMSLYRYVTGKDELLMLMVDAAAGAPTPDPEGSGDEPPDWRTALERFSRQQHQLLRKHPWVAEIPLVGPPITPSQIGWMEYGLRSMAGTGLDEGEKIAVLGMIALYVRNEAKLEYDMARARKAAEEAAAASGAVTLQAGPGAYGQVGPASYGELLRRLIDPQRYPALMAVVESGVFEEQAGYSDEDFEFGLQRILDGIAALIASRSPSGS